MQQRHTIQRRFLSSIFLFSFLLMGISIAQAATKVQIKVEKFKLSNGLTVLVHDDPSVPLLSYQQWFRVGSANEKPGRTGFAHFFEHLMFKGTKKYSGDEYERILQMNGGSNNAFTTRDLTGYYTNLPSDKLELIMDIESDRMRNLVFDQKGIDSEREVVKEERRMRYENSVYGSLLLEVISTVFKTSPYRWPTIGYMKDLNAAKLEEFQEFYNQYYVPNNAVIVVAGQVNPGQVKKLIEKYYGDIPSKPLPEFKPTPEAEQKSMREATLEKDVQAETVAVVYPTVSLDHPDAYALDFLAAALAGGESSRMYKRIVYKNALATSISGDSSTNKLAGYMGFYMGLKPGVDSARAVQLLLGEIKEVRDKNISEAEMVKLRNSTKTSALSELKTIAGRAEALANYEVQYGDYNRLFTDLDKYDQVTADDIRRVASLYLAPNRRSVVKIVPKKSQVTAVAPEENATSSTPTSESTTATAATEKAPETAPAATSATAPAPTAAAAATPAATDSTTEKK